MDDAITAGHLADAVAQASRAAKFCSAGCLPTVDPGVVVDGLGAIKLPLMPAAAKKLIAASHVAPYGKGAQTLVDTKVRKTFELAPGKFRLDEKWNAAVADATRLAASELGLPPDEVEAKLYKLLIYERGGFFLPHRDSEKQNGMVASLIVVLANPFEGGALVVRHGNATQTLTFKEAASGQAPCYAAFYADCEHEVKHVTHGVRLCLAYNLSLKRKRARPLAPAESAAPSDALAEAIRSWTATQSTKPLVFALEHHYTERGLALDLLKGADRRLAKLVLPAAEIADCFAHLAQVSRHLQQFADDGSFGRERHWGFHSPRKITVGETYQDELLGFDWTDPEGKKQPWGAIALDVAAIVSSLPIDQWKPTEEQFEGYTGNAGNTLDRWYHRSAIVLWGRDRHFDILAKGGQEFSIPLLSSMMTKLGKAPKMQREEARGDCVRFARAIVATWPRRYAGYDGGAQRHSSPLDKFADLLRKLSDRETIALFLARLAREDSTTPLASLLVAACREFGWSALAPELRQLLAERPADPRRFAADRREDIPLRDVEWLSALCLDKTSDADKSAVARELCALAAARFCRPEPDRSTAFGSRSRREPSVAERSLPPLLQALAAAGCDKELSQVIQFVESSSQLFSLDMCQVPCLKELVPWSRKRFGEVHPQLLPWLASVRRKLESATAERPTPPGDWARLANVNCNCRQCAQLRAFLADPALEVGRIPAREDLRQHVIAMIDRHDCDVKHSLERKSSPFSLVLTKTTGSFQRATKRFEADCKLLKILDAVEEA